MTSQWLLRRFYLCWSFACIFLLLAACSRPGKDLEDRLSGSDGTPARKAGASDPDDKVAEARIVFFGDSITKAGTRPDGYVSLVAKRLPGIYPDKDVEVLAAGVSGDTVSDLQARFDRDVLSRDPTHVVIYIGVNEVGQRRSSSRVAETDRHSYRNGLTDIIERVKAAGARPYLCTPAVFGDDPDNGSNANRLLDEYAGISREVAAATGAPLCDLRAAFREFLRTHNPNRRFQGVVTVDGVHLNERGNRVVAAEILRVLDEAEGPAAA